MLEENPSEARTELNLHTVWGVFAIPAIDNNHTPDHHMDWGSRVEGSLSKRTLTRYSLRKSV